MLLTSIPYFREVIVASFRCDHCGNTNNEIQSAGEIRRKSRCSFPYHSTKCLYLEAEGTIYTARILSRRDLNRQLVRSASCTIVIPEFELTLPANRGQLTTVEGLLRDVVADLSGDQPLRRIQDEPSYIKIQAIVDSLKKILGDDENEGNPGPTLSASEKNDVPMPTFTIKLDDPTGNSFIEWFGSMADPKWNLRTYKRSRQQNIDLGFSVPNEGQVPLPPTNAEDPIGDDEDRNAEIFVFPGICSSCGAPLNTLMKRVTIPYFKVGMPSVSCYCI